MSLLLLSLLVADLPGSGWTGFLGPPNAVTIDADLPQEWSPESLAYTIDLPGYGQSSPVVLDGTIYITSTEGDMKDECIVSAYALEDGTERWSKRTTNPTPFKNNVYVSRAAPTPVVDSDGVVAFFEGGRLLAYTPDGEERWNRDLTADYGPIVANFGLSASLAQDADHAFVHVERETDPYLMAVRKSDGETVWKVEGFGSSTWASPMLMNGPDGKTQLVVSAAGFAGGFDPATGERLWTLDGLSGNTAPSPYPAGDGQFLVGGSGGRRDPDGPASNGLVKVTLADDGTQSAKLVWEAQKARSSFGTPVAAAGQAYFVNRSGVVFSYDLETGEPRFTRRISGSGWATPLVAGDRLFFVDKDGGTTILATGPEGEELARNRVWEASDAPARFGSGPVQYAVAAVDGTLLLRSGDKLYAVR